MDHFPVEVLCHLLRPLLSPAYRCTTAFGGAPSPPDVVSLEHALALAPAPRRGFLATLAQGFIDKLSEKMTAAGKAADFAKVFGGDELDVSKNRGKNPQNGWFIWKTLLKWFWDWMDHV